MTTVFVGGSRRVTRLPIEARNRINNIVQKGFAVLVGDAQGVDKAVQKYLADVHYDNVTVYCSGHTSRNNIGQWETRNVSVGEREKNFQFYAAKDREMAQQAEFGLMIWDGKSPGTILNVLRLVRASKKAVLICVPEKVEVEFRSKEDWNVFLMLCTSKLLRDLKTRAIPDELLMLRPEHDDQRSWEVDEQTESSTAWSDLKSKMDGALAIGDARTFISLLGRMAKERGMSRVAQETGLAREALYRALSAEGNPEFVTVVKLARTLGLQLSAARKSQESNDSN